MGLLKTLYSFEFHFYELGDFWYQIYLFMSYFGLYSTIYSFFNSLTRRPTKLLSNEVASDGLAAENGREYVYCVVPMQ